jgi:hypothetical protein
MSGGTLLLGSPGNGNYVELDIVGNSSFSSVQVTISADGGLRGNARGDKIINTGNCTWTNNSLTVNGTGAFGNQELFQFVTATNLTDGGGNTVAPDPNGFYIPANGWSYVDVTSGGKVVGMAIVAYN